jgi:threonine synthase
VRVAKALGDFLILNVMYESGGFGVAVTDDDVHATRRQISEDDGVLLSPEGAACVAAWRVAVADGRVARTDRAVVFNTATGLRTPMPAQLGRVDITRPIDYAHH